jgi:hypothetical protein
MAIMGIVLIQNITMLEVWEQLLNGVESFTGITNTAIIFTAVFAIGVMTPVLLLSLSSRIAARRNTENWVKNFARFGYALIPLDIAGHVAHNLFHLLAEGKSIYYSVASIFGSNASGSAALVSNDTIQIIQFIILALGFWGAIYTAKRIAYRRYSTNSVRTATLKPIVILISALTALNVVLFLLPMAHRM